MSNPINHPGGRHFDKEPSQKMKHAHNATRKAAGWAFAEGMTLQQFLVAAQSAFANAEKERPHV